MITEIKVDHLKCDESTIIEFDYEVIDNNGNMVMHTTINGEGRVAQITSTKKRKKKINKDTINVRDKWLY